MINVARKRSNKLQKYKALNLKKVSAICFSQVEVSEVNVVTFVNRNNNVYKEHTQQCDGLEKS